MNIRLSKPQAIERYCPEIEKLITREGKAVDISGDTWRLPYSVRDNSTLNFTKIINPEIREALKDHVAEQLKRISTHAGYVAYQDVWREVLRYWGSPASKVDSESHLIDLFETAINRARSRKRLWAMYRPIQWYIWSADNKAEYGFSETYAQELEALELPGNPKGEAVRMEDPESGPLHKSLELPLLINALKSDDGRTLEHLQQRVVVALSIAFGRNPANLTFLRESDFERLAPLGDDPCYIIRMPRIKKRFVNPRDDLLVEYLDPHFGAMIEQLIEISKLVPLSFANRAFVIPEKRPLLINRNGNKAAILSKDIDNVFNLTSSDISRLLSAFVKRHNIISPLTGELMCVTPRRLRYTLATGLAAEGISKRELARILDHTDTQHVHVYFEMAGRIVEHLDKATAKGFSKYLNFFNGRLIDSDEDAVNGERGDKHLIFIDEQNPTDQADIGVCGESSVCHLDPPYSCYLCPKFQPYRHANHEHVLECLLAGREERLKKYDNARLGIQLDEVIAAVAQVAKLCEEGGRNV
ncbi:tyrosine-type recombinase/integrase [Thorsellia anophelis]|uniref:Phage integrase family protein n=1 Tax=Thorsellia anophelis DSM 18579 TaxID=1123402 RepID=A0A1I0CFE9_9GAMM|nr:tyrosine-type recombinase/integrase [Thorsellia anophelis]SES74588.1 Phage integrase family protein [Thorsellia anophelis DSM 18579]SET14041.1 Phage integrase family protein [Thorsellia anophelis DSM 18579]SET17836.1 Phage integrase family protein [Thorsellia anophelis DSM 18579]SET47656.1 Phage integrase family protein [Thorsellia anophelis DSM 18579]